MTARSATIARRTRETDIRTEIDLDGRGSFAGETGVGFFDHMLEQTARHGMIDLSVHVGGDLHVDAHHTVEDVGISIGRALAEAWGDKSGLARYGHAWVPLDEALSRVVIDLSGRPGLFYDARYPSERIGAFDTELVREFFQGLVNHADMTLHMDNLKGANSHHIAETLFKAFGRALRMAASRDDRLDGAMPSTKGAL